MSPDQKKGDARLTPELLALRTELHRRTLREVEHVIQLTDIILRDRRVTRNQARRAGRAAGPAKRRAAIALLDAIETVRARHTPPLSTAAAARVYLQDHDPHWLAATEVERDRKVAALKRRLTRARKYTGQ